MAEPGDEWPAAPLLEPIRRPVYGLPDATLRGAAWPARGHEAPDPDAASRETFDRGVDAPRIQRPSRLGGRGPVPPEVHPERGLLV